MTNLLIFGDLLHHAYNSSHLVWTYKKWHCLWKTFLSALCQQCKALKSTDKCCPACIYKEQSEQCIACIACVCISHTILISCFIHHFNPKCFTTLLLFTLHSHQWRHSTSFSTLPLSSISANYKVYYTTAFNAAIHTLSYTGHMQYFKAENTTQPNHSVLNTEVMIVKTEAFFLYFKGVTWCFPNSFYL